MVQSANGRGQLSRPSFCWRLFIENLTRRDGWYFFAYTDRLLPLIRRSDLTSTGTASVGSGSRKSTSARPSALQ